MPFFQPIIDVSNKAVYRYECLLRLLKTNEQLICPSQQHHYLDDDDLNPELLDDCIAESIRIAKQRQLKFNINISKHLFVDASAVFSFLQRMDCTDNSGIGLEIPESIAEKHMSDLRRLTQKLPSLYICIDQVSRLHADMDAYFFAGIKAVKLHNIQTFDKTQLKQFAHHCEQHQIDLIADHVDQQSQLNQLLDSPIRYAQGHYLTLFH